MQIGSLVAFSLSLYYLALFWTEQTCLCFFVNSTPLRFVQIFRTESITDRSSLNFLRLRAVLDGVAGSQHNRSVRSPGNHTSTTYVLLLEEGAVDV